MNKNGNKFSLVKDVNEINVGDTLNLTTINGDDFVCEVISIYDNVFEMKPLSGSQNHIISTEGMRQAIISDLIYKQDK